MSILNARQLASGRATALATLTSTCVITRVTGRSANGEGGWTNATTTISDVKCRVQWAGGTRKQDSGVEDDNRRRTGVRVGLLAVKFDQDISEDDVILIDGVTQVQVTGVPQEDSPDEIVRYVEIKALL